MPPKRKTGGKKAQPDQRISPGRYLISTKPEPATCHCGRFIVRGRAEGRKLELDPLPLSESQIRLARAVGLAVCVVDNEGLCEITDWRGSLPGSRYPQHRCKIRWSIETDVITDTRFAISPIPEEPPF